MTTEELNEAVLNCTMPSSGDGICNADRTWFVLQAFNATALNLNKKMPYEEVLASTNAEKIRASVHLAKMQFQYTYASAHAGLLDGERAELYAAYLHLMIGKLTWHLTHVEKNVPTPPHGFIN